MRFSPLAMDLHGRSSVVRSSNDSSAIRPFKPWLACAVFAATLAGTFGVTAAQGANAVGSITGSAAVTANGAATYTIPISLPPGTNGMEPSIALAYNSQSGDGLAGYGWTLSGFSTITRCPWTLDSSDGQSRAVQLTGPGSTSDDFCLDGEHLLLKGSATYGANGAVYHTAVENFSYIVSHGSAGNGPSYFTVQTKDGKLYEYGNTTDSQILAVGTSTVRVWALDKVTDLNGNYYSFSYQNNDTTTGDYWPLSVSYTGNSNAGTSPLHTVSFSWTPRSDASVQASFVAGSLVTLTQLLTGVTVSYNGSTSFSYTLSYQTDNANFRNQLASVRECDGGGNCLPATTIQWQSGAAGWGPDINTGVSVSDAQHATAAHLMDVDGDGIMDLVYPDTTTGDWAVMFGQPGGGFTGAYDTGDPLWAGQTYYQFALATEYDGSGRQSLMVPVPSGWQVLVPTGNRGNGQGVIFRTPGNSLPNLSANNSVTGLPIYEGNTWAVDFFGRGLSDVAYTDGTNLYLVQNGSTSATTVFSLQSTTWKSTTTSSFSDVPMNFDGSGRGGALTYFSTQNECLPDGCKPPPPTVGYKALGAKGSTSGPSYGGLGTISETGISPEPIDATGGGMTDLLSSNGAYQLELSTGAGFKGYAVGVNDAQAVDDVIADYYGDGRQEAVVYDPNPSTQYGLIRLNYSIVSNADTFVPTVTNVSTALMPGYVKGSLRVGNINANGLDDLVYSTQSGSTYTWHYRLHNGGAADLVTSITDGLGNVTSFTYAALDSGATLASGGAVYTRGSGASYPINDVAGPLQVVTTETESDGAGSTYTLSYAYSGGRYDWNGLGFLGFLGRTIQDSRYSTTETIAYNLTFPWIGMVTSDVVARSSDGTPIHAAVNSGPDQVSFVGQYTTSYFPFFDTSTSTDYNFAGASQVIRNATTTLNQADFDAYGNILTRQTTITDGGTNSQFTTLSTTSYATPNTSTYCVALPAQLTVQRTSPGSSLSRVISTVAGDLDTTHCRVNSQVTASGESGDGTPAVTEAYQYDSFGNLSETQISGPGLATRTTLLSSQGGDGEFTTSVTQAASATVSLVTATSWNYALGLKASDTDANGNVTSYTYDGFGRVTKVKRPDGTSTKNTYAWCSAPTAGVTCPSNGSYEITATQVGSDGTAITTGYTAYDMKNRPVEKGTVLLGGVMSLVDTTYDDAGHVISISRPHFSGQSTVYKTTYSYAKAFNRLIQVDEPVNASDTASTGSVTTLGYSVVSGSGYALTATQTVAGVVHTTVQYTDAMNDLVETVDANGGQTSHTYDAFGDVLTTTDADGKVASTVYDGLGHKIAMTDPDLGHWTYQVDALGNVLCQTDADNQSIIMTYDGMGRIASKLATAPGAGCSATTGVSSAWAYDQTGALGLPASVSDSNGFQHSYTYDNLDRPDVETTTVNGTAYSVSTSYDNFSRVQTVTYPVSVTPAAASVPVAVASPTSGTVIQNAGFNLDGSASTDPNGLPLEYSWSQAAGPGPGQFTLTDEAKTTFSAAVPGNYSLQLQVADDDTSGNPAAVSLTVLPAAPGTPSAPSLSSTGSVTITWSNVANVTSYQLYESTDGTSYAQIQTVNSGSGSSSATVSALTDGTYYFTVAACANGVCGAQSSPVTVQVLFPPAAPTSLSVNPATSISGSFTLSWTAPATAAQYRIYQSTNGGSSYTWVDTFNNSSSGTITRTESGLADGNYTYTVAAWNQGGQGPSSATASGTVLHIPGAPGAASVNPTTVAGGDTFTLSWGRASGTVSYYIVNGGTTHYTGLSTTLTAGVKAGTHNYYVQACNASGCGGDSASATLTDTGVGTGCPPPPMQCQLVLDDDIAARGTSSSHKLDEVSNLLAALEPAAGVMTAQPQQGDELQSLSVSAELPGVRRAFLALPARSPASRTALATLRRERHALVKVFPLWHSESQLEAVTARRILAGLPTVLPSTSERDLVAWNARQQARARANPNGPVYDAPAYIAYGDTKVVSATSTPYQFAVTYVYDPASGNLSAVQNAQTGFTYWQASTANGSMAPVDPFGHILAYTDGNNVSTVESYDLATGSVTGISSGVGQSSSVQQLAYTWDGFGNLQQRCDANRGLVENATYDTLNRLKTSNVNTGLTAGSCSGGNPGAAISVSYDAVGNIQNLTNSGSATIGGTYTYDPNHAHAVSTVSNLPGTFAYDANGNMLSGNGRTIVWNADNLPVSITSAGTVVGNNTVSGTSTFSYGPDLQRYFQSATDTAGHTVTTTYIGHLFEIVSASNGTTTYRHNIVANGQVVAIHSIDQGGNASTSYVHTDSLGSVDAVTNDLGTVVQSMSFDAFGLRRDPGNWAYDLAQTTGQNGITDRGYTFQEQLDDVALVHMNGRVYDPTIGRFISADPVESSNRYTYVDDDPLSATDPSGYCRWGCFWQPGRQLSDLKTLTVDAWHFINHPAKVLEYTAPGLGNWINVRFSHSATLQRDMGDVALVVSVVLTCTGIGAPIAAAVYAGYEAYITDINGGSGLQIAEVGAVSYMKAYETDVQWAGYYQDAVSVYNGVEAVGGFSGIVSALGNMMQSGSSGGGMNMANMFNDIYQAGKFLVTNPQVQKWAENKAEDYAEKRAREYVADKIHNYEMKLEQDLKQDTAKETGLSVTDINTILSFDYTGWAKAMDGILDGGGG